MKRPWVFGSLGVPALLFGLVSGALACGGQRAYIADDPAAYGEVRKAPSGLRGTRGKDQAFYVMKEDLKVSKALADAIVRRYLEKKYPGASHLHFEGFVYEHGYFVYMYDTEVSGPPMSVHVGSVEFASQHLHIHVDAMTGDVYGPGCGGGPGQVDMAFEASEYPEALKTQWPKAVQFDSELVIREGQAPKIDGLIDGAEWQGAAKGKVQIGTDRKEITNYG
jgi:hypothetical protein